MKGPLLTAPEFIQILHGVKSSGAGWEARRPAHADRKASLTRADSGLTLAIRRANVQIMKTAMGTIAAGLFLVAVFLSRPYVVQSAEEPTNREPPWKEFRKTTNLTSLATNSIAANLADENYSLGRRYLYGRGVKPDGLRGVRLIRQAAEEGLPEAEGFLADLYAGNVLKAARVLQVSDTEAFKWYRKAAQHGLATAQCEVGRYYLWGTGVAQDGPEALKWYRKAAEQGYAKAQGDLGAILREGETTEENHTIWKGVQKDPEESAKWLKKAAESYRLLAEKGDFPAQHHLALAYENGWGVPQDLEESAKWYRSEAEPWRQKADKGDPQAMTFLAHFYAEGKGLPKDQAEANKLYRRAAEKGDPGAQVHLGLAYKAGIWGMPRDFVSAYMWMNLAAAQGDTVAEAYRNLLATKMTPQQVAEAQRLSAAFVPRTDPTYEDVGLGVSPEGGEKPSGTGTGFFVTADGYLLTSHHVVEGASRVVIQCRAGRFPAKVVVKDAANDLALLKVSGSFTPLRLASSRTVKLGEVVFTVGFPNIELQGQRPKLTKGEISSLAGLQDDPRQFQISVPVQPGNSGGPLVSESGAVIGLVQSKLSPRAALKTVGMLPENVNYATKSSYALLLVETVPDANSKLPATPSGKARPWEEVVNEVEDGVALILSF